MFYLIDHGKVNVQVDTEGQVKQLTTIGAGGYFGELALLNEEPRAASVIALEKTEIYRLNKTDFLAVIKNSPELGDEIRNMYMLYG